MKTSSIIVVATLCLLLLNGCEESETYSWERNEPEEPSKEAPAQLPDGCFEVVFSTGCSGGTRAQVTGADGRIRHLRYLVYKSTGEFVKEKVLVRPTDATPIWPLDAIRDTLPKGTYKAVFLANVEKTLFPIPIQEGGVKYNEVLTEYQSSYSEARIVLPNAAFSDTSEYYWAKVSFSDTAPQPSVLLQRIITLLNLHRNLVDAQTALNQLVLNIVTQLKYKNYIQTTVQGLLPNLLRTKMDLGVGNTVYVLVGGLDKAVGLVADVVLLPVTELLYAQLLQGLVNQIGLALTGNATQQGALSGLGVLLNPWAQNEADTPIVTLRNFPKKMDFELSVKETFEGDQRFKCAFSTGTVYDQKDVYIKGFNGAFDVRKIDVIKKGLVSGLLIDRTIDSSLLLNGTFIDVNTPILATVATNFRYKANYSLVDIGLKSYAQQTDGNHTLTLSVKLKQIANLDNLLAGIPVLGDLLSTVVKSAIGDVTVTLPVNLPLLGADNLTLSGGWSSVTTY